MLPLFLCFSFQKISQLCVFPKKSAKNAHPFSPTICMNAKIVVPLQAKTYAMFEKQSIKKGGKDADNTNTNDRTTSSDLQFT